MTTEPKGELLRSARAIREFRMATMLSDRLKKDSEHPSDALLEKWLDGQMLKGLIDAKTATQVWSDRVRRRSAHRLQHQNDTEEYECPF